MQATQAVSRRLSRAQAKQRTLEALLVAAERTFARVGYQDATIDMIAADAGYTKGAVYTHFKSKEELFCVLLDRVLKRNAARFNRMLDMAEDNSELLVGEVASWVDFIDERDDLPTLALELELEARRNPHLSLQFKRAMEDHWRSLGKVFERYFAAIGREPPLPAHQLADSLISLATGVALSRRARSRPDLSAVPLIRVLLGIPADRHRPTSDEPRPWWDE